MKRKMINEVIVTPNEIDEIALIVSAAYLELYEGRYCRLDNREQGYY